MRDRSLDALIIGDPANMNWLTGFDAWSFYVPQIMLLTHDRGPVWMGREMDAGAVSLTTYMGKDDIQPYPEQYVQRNSIHPMHVVAESLCEAGLNSKRIGYESDTYFFSPKALDCLQKGVPSAQWIDADRLVNWCRVIKSDTEIEMMRQAARLAEQAMQTACDTIEPGVRQCDLMAKIIATQVGGNQDFGGDMTALSPLVLAGEAASTAHPMWTDEKFVDGQTVALELGGTRKRYNAGLARTFQLGSGSQTVFDTSDAVQEGLDAVLASIKAGVVASDVHRAWQQVLDKHGLVKESRIGYSIGVGYPPDWGERTASLRPGDKTELQSGMCFHFQSGMWLDNYGAAVSEPIVIGARGGERLSDVARELIVIN